jgi:hypothetical protein
VSESSPPTPAPPPPSDAAPSEKPKRKWRRRLRRTLVVLILLGLVVRVGLFYAIRPILRKVGAAYNVNITFERQEIMLSAADVGFSNINVTPTSGGPALLNAEYIRGHISITELLKGKLHVYRAEADGVDLNLARTKDGRLPMLEQILGSQPAKPPPATKPEQQLDFTSPLKVDAFRLQHVRANLRDDSIVPPLQAMLAMDVRVSHLGEMNRPILFEANIWSDPALDLLRVTGQGRADGRNIDATFGVFMRGLHLKPLAGYLASFGVRPYENDLGMKLSGTLKTEAATTPDGVKVELGVDRLDVTSQARPVASIEQLRFDADEVGPAAAKIASVLITGVRAHAERSEDGLIRVAGVELVGGGAPSTTTTPSTTQPYRLSLRDVVVRDVQADVHDASVAPAADLKLVMSELASRSGGVDPSNPESVVPVSAAFSLPGLAESVMLRGQLKPFAPAKTVELTFAADGIRPDAAKPYLASAGIESLLKSGHAEGKLAATIRNGSADALLSDLRLTDGPELIAMRQLRITSAGIDGASGRATIAAVEASGPSVDVTRDATGRITAAGFRYTPGASAPGSAVAKTNAPPPPPPTTNRSLADLLPRIEIGRIAWQGLHLTLRDEQTQPPSVIAINDAGIEGSDLLLDLSFDTEAKPGKLRMHLSSPSLAKQLTFDTTLHPRRNALGADFSARGDGLNLKPLAVYLAPLGIEPVMADGELKLDGHVDLKQEPDRLAATLSLSNVKLASGTTELGGMDGLRVADLSLMNGGTIDVKSVQIEHPRISVGRDGDGVLSALGVRLVATTQPTAAAPSAAPSTTAPSVVAPRPSPPLVASLGDLRVENAELNWNDRAPATPVSLHATASLQASKLVVGKPAEPAVFRATLSITDLVEELKAAGRIDASPGAVGALASIEAKGVRGGPIAPYLPPGLELATKDGRFKASIDARLSAHAQGGSSARLAVQNLDWRDGEAPAPLFAFDTLTLAANRIDPAANIIAIDEVSLAGLTTRAELAKDGSTHAVGLAITTPKKTAPPKPDSAPAAIAQAAPSTNASDENQAVAQLVAEARRPLPLVTLQKLDLNVRSAKLLNLAMPDAAPLDLHDVRLRNESPIQLGGPNASNQPPVRLALTGAIAPVVGTFQISASATPFATAPAGTIDVRASGIQGSGVTDLLPGLRDHLKGDALTDGRFNTQLQAQLKFDRRGPRDFDLSRGFQVDLLVEKTEFRDRENGPVLAGLESIRADQVRVEPKTGSVIAKLIELSKPQLLVVRETSGIHSLGFTIPTTQATTQATTQPAETEVAVAPAPLPETPPANSGPTTAPTSEIRIDRLTLSGLDVRVEDRSVDPPTIVPLNNMDLDVRGFTTRALVEPKMVRFAMTLSADKVPLPQPKQTGGGVVGALGAITSGEQAPTTRTVEQRELLSQISTSGQIGFYPKLSGYVRGSLSGIELAGFQGEARSAGVDMNGGVFDGTFDIRFLENGDMATRSKFVFTDLQAAEPPNGPISKHLALPAPLDAVIGALRDPGGSITVPVNMTVKNNEITGGAIAGAAAGAIGPIIATALASAPVKVVAGAGELIGLGNVLGGKDKSKPREPVVVPFAPGATALEATAAQQLAGLLDELQRDSQLRLTIRPSLGAQDVAILAARVNPPREDALALAAQLRSEKSKMADDRAKLASQAQAQLALASADQHPASLQKLRDLDREMARVETSLDQLYDLLRPGADRRAAQRTRAACIQLSEARGRAVLQALRDPRMTNFDDRVQVVNDHATDVADDAGGRVTITVISKKH